MRNEKSIFNQNLAFCHDISKFQIVLSIFHFYKAGKNEKKCKKRLAHNSSSKKQSFMNLQCNYHHFMGQNFSRFFSRFSRGIPFFFSFLTRNSKPSKMQHVVLINHFYIRNVKIYGNHCVHRLTSIAQKTMCQGFTFFVMSKLSNAVFVHVHTFK